MRLDDVIFFFLRHGETAGNKKKIYRSWSNDPDAQLDEKGRKDTQDAGRYLSAIGAPIELIIADSLDRVQESIELAAQIFPEARIEFVRALHPLNMGDWTLKPKEEHPVEPYLKDKTKRIPGGETVAEFDARQDGIFTKIFGLTKEIGAGRILVGGHGSNVAYLFNRVFNTGDDEVGYEGLVEPGGLIAATAKGLVPLTKVRGKKPEGSLVDEALPLYPSDHQAGMKVPKGGSMCANCDYLGDDRKTCTEENFIRWNGSDVIPGEIDAYCSDFYEPKEYLDGNS